mmetsp:Transcript_58/g.199  ORF Transcript_58/g.199 Transcript_58/m.199 type:complete len:89 (-) Transcript_58:471-737(-)
MCLTLIHQCGIDGPTCQAIQSSCSDGAGSDMRDHNAWLKRNALQRCSRRTAMSHETKSKDHFEVIGEPDLRVGVQGHLGVVAGNLAVY